ILPGAPGAGSRGASHLLVAGSNPAGGTRHGISWCFSSLGRRFESCRGHQARDLVVLLISWSQVRILPGAPGRPRIRMPAWSGAQLGGFRFLGIVCERSDEEVVAEQPRGVVAPLELAQPFEVPRRKREVDGRGGR